MKLIGCVLVIFSSLLATFSYDLSYKKRMRSIKEIITFIENIHTEIEYHSRSISEIFKSYKENSMAVKELIETGACPDIKCPEAQERVSALFLSLGRGYKKEQLKMCEAVCKRLDNVYNEQLSQYKGKVKIFSTMSVFTAVCTLVLII